MKTFARASLATLVALVLSFAATAALAIEYDDVVGLARQGVSDRTIVELIVKDGRAFDMNDDEIATLRDEGVSEVVIDAMLDPVAGQDWLDGRSPDDESYDQGGYSGSDSDGYSTSLDQAYGRGYSDGRSTALVFSFGYYYGPLARYYYCDPFYYPFWYSGYASSYWPSYCAFYWRPSYSWAYAYPYNWYNYDSYYCYTYYDPGYYAHRGYTVQPGYGRTVWDNGPRWRNGGMPPGGNGRIDGTPAMDRVRERLLAGRPAAPPVIRSVFADRPARGATTRGDLPVGSRWRDGRVAREVTPAPAPGRTVTRTPAPIRRDYRGSDPVRRVIRADQSVPRRSTAGGQGQVGREGRLLRPQPSRQVIRGTARSGREVPGGYDTPRRVARAPLTRYPEARRAPEPRVIEPGVERVLQRREPPAEARENRQPPAEARPSREPAENRQPQPEPAIRRVLPDRGERQDRGR